MRKEARKEYKDLLSECFASDQELLNKYHIEAGKGLDICVERTYKDLSDIGVDVFALKEQDKLVGYYGIENGDFLTGFFIKPEYRTKHYIKKFWSFVDEHFKHSYMAGVYSKNTKAIDFLLKRGRVAFIIPEVGVFVQIDKGMR